MLAGPGSGKTHTIVKRISYLLEQGTAPERILVITFTKEAAVSMQRRFREASKEVYPVNFGTFHSVFYHILKESHYCSTQKLLTNQEKISRMLFLLKARRREQRESVSDGGLREDAVQLLGAVSYYKNTFCREEALLRAPVRWQGVFWELYAAYEEEVRRAHAMDFDDMLFLCEKLLRENRAVRESWRKRFSHILIDEFQDINPVQYEIVKLLAAPPYQIFAVGDDDQSIYGFRGAAPACLKRFEADFSARRILLDVNYRSGKRIVEASLAVMRQGRDRFEKRLRAGKTEESAVSLRAFDGKEQERRFLLERLEELWKAARDRDARNVPAQSASAANQGAENEAAESAPAQNAPAQSASAQIGTVAVLFRTNAAMQGFAAALRQRGIAFRMKEESKSIYEHFIVQDIMAYLLLAEGEGSRELLLRILNKPYRQISRESAAQGEPDGMRQLKRQLACIKGFPLPLAIRYICKAVGYERYLQGLSVEKPEKRQEWQELLEWLKCDAADYATAAEWREAQRLYGERLERERGKRKGRSTERREEFAVQLMTVHAAKGLEFDTVFIPDCNEGVFPYGHMPDTQSVEEERRILYVAMTRAKSSLELCYLTGTEKSPRLPSRFLNPLFDLKAINSRADFDSRRQ